MIENWVNKKAEEYLDIIKNHVNKDNVFLSKIALHLAREHQNLGILDDSSFYDLNHITDEHTTCFIHHMEGGQEQYIKILWREFIRESQLECD